MPKDDENNNKNKARLTLIENALNQNYSKWQEFVNWVHREPEIAVLFAVFGSLLFLIPTIITIVAAFSADYNDLGQRSLAVVDSQMERK